MPKSLVLGLGNPILGDDSIGFRLAELLDERLGSLPETDFLSTSLAGIRLLDQIQGYDRLIVLDSMTTGRHPTGTITAMEIEDLAQCGVNRLSVHHIPFTEILELGRSSGLDIPDEIRIYAIEIEYPLEAGEDLSPALDGRIEEYMRTIIENEFSDGVA